MNVEGRKLKVRVKAKAVTHCSGCNKEIDVGDVYGVDTHGHSYCRECTLIRSPEEAEEQDE